MANIIEQANAAYEARDSAQAQMAALKQQADKEHSEFEREWKELGRLIENDKRMKEFMRAKARGEGAKGGDAPMKEDDRHRKKIAQNASDTSKSLMDIERNQDKAVTYEEAFARIQAATGICDIDELVQNFLHAEDNNFTLFKFNNELTAEIEKLEQHIQDYKEEEVNLKGLSNKKEDVEKTKFLESLEERWNELDKKAIHYENKHSETQAQIKHCCTCIETMFQQVGASETDLPS